MIPDAKVIADLIPQVEAEYRALPGLKLTVPQARRLWGLDEHVCTALFEELLHTHFLTRRDDGMYVRSELLVGFRSRTTQ